MPPEKNIVMIHSVVMNLWPIMSFFTIGYAVMIMSIMEHAVPMTAMKIVFR